MWFSVLGRQTELSLAELEAHYGSGSVRPLAGSAVALLDAAEPMNIDRFGGQMKTGAVLTEVEVQSQTDVASLLVDLLPQSDKKIHVGISWYEPSVSAQSVHALALSVKKLAKTQKRKLRLVPNRTPALSTAQVLHNRLTEAPNIELVVVKSADNRLVVGRTHQVQDIEAYTRRDQERPARDAKVGMLPPKLAQIMLNLAKFQPGQTVLDPFCGSGVVLQEALLLGGQAYGSDISERMVRMSEANLLWLIKQHPELSTEHIHLEVADARNRRWLPPIDAVVSETYLGPPLTAMPKPDQLQSIISEVDPLIQDTLKNLAKQLPADTRVVLAVPAWRTERGFVPLPSVDQLDALGYTRASFTHCDTTSLVYARADQAVGRQLLVMTRN